MLLKHWFLLFFFFRPCSASLILVLEWHVSGQEVGAAFRWQGNKELVKWRGMSFRESQHGIVFNPWLCGSPGMPSLLLPPPQRQGIKDTLHLFDLVCLLRLFYSLIFGGNIALLFFMFRDWNLWIFLRFLRDAVWSLFRCYCYTFFCPTSENFYSLSLVLSTIRFTVIITVRALTLLKL